jgi:hypothetical protein
MNGPVDATTAAHVTSPIEAPRISKPSNVTPSEPMKVADLSMALRNMSVARARAALPNPDVDALQRKRPKFRAKNNSRAGDSLAFLNVGPDRTPNTPHVSYVQRAYPKTFAPSKPLLVAGLFNDRATVERACQSVTERGYVYSEINLLMSDETRCRHFQQKAASGLTHEQPARESGLRFSAGEIDDAIAAAAASFGRTLTLPGLSVVIAGPLAAAPLKTYSAAAGLLGTLASWNIPEKRVMDYEAALRQGKILMSVKPRTLADANHFEKAWSKDDADLWGRGGA